MTVTIVVLDSVGVGALPDAADFGDEGSHTLDHTLAAAPVNLPNLTQLGLGNIPGVDSLPEAAAPAAAFGRMAEKSAGKDTSTGHWEFIGIILDEPFRTFERFPDEVMQEFDRLTGREHLGNFPASGTEIIAELGEEHLRTGRPIVYTSADSVFQVAAHVDAVPLDLLYGWCQGARQILTGENAVARVIARPFDGRPGQFNRLGGARKDYSVAPPTPNVLTAIAGSGLEVVSIGKIADIFDGVGITREVKAGSNLEGIERTAELMHERPQGLVFTNLVEFDSLYGHRRDAPGYSSALAEFDERLPDLLEALEGDDVLFLVSDHGNDPTWHGSDHTREYGMLLACGPGVRAAALGTRDSFADLGATVAELLGAPWRGPGTSFASSVLG